MPLREKKNFLNPFFSDGELPTALSSRRGGGGGVKALPLKKELFLRFFNSMFGIL